MFAPKLDKCVNVMDLRRRMHARLPAPALHYIEGGADDEWTLARNRNAFADYELLPRVLIDIGEVSLKAHALGADLDWPVIMGPTGLNRLFDPEGECAAARAAERTNTAYSLSTLGNTSIEEVAKNTSGHKFYQIYVLKDRGLAREHIDRARAAGYKALLLTVDVPVAGNRERDLRTGMTTPPKLTLKSLAQFAARPGWAMRYLGGRGIDFPNFSDAAREAAKDGYNVAEYVAQQFDPGVTWKHAEEMIRYWGGPFAIKGLITADDARRAADIGASAVVLSNHGGRQLDGAPAPVDQVAEVVDAVGDRIEVLMDGGIRRGADVAKALALGARAVLIGRAYLYGLGAGGEAGVIRALTILRQELIRTMKLIGCTDVTALNRQYVRKRQ